MKKRKWVCLLFCFTLCLSLLSSSASAASENRTLRVFNWGEYISDGSDDSMNVIKEFTRRTGIQVDYQVFSTNEEMYAKIISGSADYDVLIPSDYMIGKMIQEDLLAKLDFSNIPNYKYIDDAFKNLEYDPANEYSVPYTWGTVGIIYNTTMVTEPVESWDILWDSNYAGQILMFNNPRDSYGIALKKLGYSQNTTDRGEIDEATDELKKQRLVVQAYVMDEIFPKMTAGEAALAPYYAGDAVTMIGDNPDLDFVVPKEGTNRFVDAMVVPKSSKNKDLAEQFINFMLEEDVALANIEYIGYSTPMSNVKELLDEEVQNSFSYPDEEVLSRCETFVNLDDETTAYMQDNWTGVLSYGNSSIGDIIFLIVFFLFLIGAVIFFTIKKRRDRAI
ncbi:MAG: ABC transporter substrate-binding protein [Oscillospiraceae bacterium]|nr:ABC transporter substrate-binding protein [Oscillospiraceae bacterium]MDY3065739.1 ABC transporter substrate-binding protein [Oscillospiraceae bacterium]